MSHRSAVVSVGIMLVVISMIITGTSLLRRSGASASTVSQVSIVEQALRSVELDAGNLSADTKVYAAEVSATQLENWLRESEIRTAARVQNRPEADVRNEWNGTQIGRLPDEFYALQDTIWVIDVRGGVNFQVGTKTMPLTLPSEDLRPEGWEPPEYDNIYVILTEDAVQIGIGAFTEPDFTPPLGSLVNPDQFFDDDYMVNINVVESETSSRAPSQSSQTFLPSVGVRANRSRPQPDWITDRALSLMNHNCSGVPGETTNIYAVHTPVDALETWLSDGAIAQTADIQGRPAAEVRQEWEAAGITFLDPTILNNYDDVWFVHARGGLSCLPGPIIPPPGGVLPTYDNIYSVLDTTGGSLMSGNLSDLSYWTPPLGDLIYSESW